MKKVNEFKKLERVNVLSGTKEIINRWFQFETKGSRYDTTTGCQELSRRRRCGEAFTLIDDLYNKIDANWASRNYANFPSKQNWRLTRELEINEKNESQEKQLEKVIVKILSDDWFNQVPTASGLTDSHSLKKASIDLVHRIRPDCYELIELKWGLTTNTTLYAAIEVLLYGILYIHARAHLEEMQYALPSRQLLIAKEIGLRVLAPKTYYREYDLGWFERNLNDGIAKFVGLKFEKLRFTVDFKFMAFPGDFQWDKACAKAELGAAMNRIIPAFLEPSTLN
jgi:hypothetical protein